MSTLCHHLTHPCRRAVIKAGRWARRALRTATRSGLAALILTGCLSDDKTPPSSSAPAPAKIVTTSAKTPPHTKTRSPTPQPNHDQAGSASRQISETQPANLQQILARGIRRQGPDPNELEAIVRQAGDQPRLKPIKVKFCVESSGETSDIQIIKRSGNDAVDQLFRDTIGAWLFQERSIPGGKDCIDGLHYYIDADSE